MNKTFVFGFLKFEIFNSLFLNIMMQRYMSKALYMCMWSNGVVFGYQLSFVMFEVNTNASSSMINKVFKESKFKIFFPP